MFSPLLRLQVRLEFLEFSLFLLDLFRLVPLRQHVRIILVQSIRKAFPLVHPRFLVHLQSFLLDFLNHTLSVVHAAIALGYVAIPLSLLLKALQLSELPPFLLLKLVALSGLQQLLCLKRDCVGDFLSALCLEGQSFDSVLEHFLFLSVVFEGDPRHEHLITVNRVLHQGA